MGYNKMALLKKKKNTKELKGAGMLQHRKTENVKIRVVAFATEFSRKLPLSIRPDEKQISV